MAFISNESTGPDFSLILCSHRKTVSANGFFRLWAKCDMCETHIWKIWNVEQCLDCGHYLHEECSSSWKKLLEIIEKPPITKTKMAARAESEFPDRETLGETRSSGKIRTATTGGRPSVQDAVLSESPDGAERRAASRKVHPTATPIATPVTMPTFAAAARTITGVESLSPRVRSKFFGEGVPKTAPREDRGKTTTDNDDDGPAGAAPAPSARDLDLTPPPGTWCPRVVTRVLCTDLPLTAVPPPPGPGKYWYGHLGFGPPGPPSWHPVLVTRPTNRRVIHEQTVSASSKDLSPCVRKFFADCGPMTAATRSTENCHRDGGGTTTTTTTDGNTTGSVQATGPSSVGNVTATQAAAPGAVDAAGPDDGLSPSVRDFFDLCKAIDGSSAERGT